MGLSIDGPRIGMVDCMARPMRDIITYHRRFHRIRRYNPSLRCRRGPARCSFRHRKRGSSPGRWARQWRAGASPSSLWSWPHSSWPSSSSRTSASQCRKQVQRGIGWLGGPEKSNGQKEEIRLKVGYTTRKLAVRCNITSSHSELMTLTHSENHGSGVTLLLYTWRSRSPLAAYSKVGSDSAFVHE